MVVTTVALPRQATRLAETASRSRAMDAAVLTLIAATQLGWLSGLSYLLFRLV